MCGSTIKLTVTSVAVAYMFGEPITFGLFMQFALMQAIAAVASPGVMGGVLHFSGANELTLAGKMEVLFGNMSGFENFIKFCDREDIETRTFDWE